MFKTLSMFKPLLLLTTTWLLATGAIQSVSAQGSYPVPVGEAHPDFQLVDVDNASVVRLSDYRGRKVLLIHFASW